MDNWPESVLQYEMFFCERTTVLKGHLLLVCIQVPADSLSTLKPTRAEWQNGMRITVRVHDSNNNVKSLAVHVDRLEKVLRELLVPAATVFGSEWLRKWRVWILERRIRFLRLKIQAHLVVVLQGAYQWKGGVAAEHKNKRFEPIDHRDLKVLLQLMPSLNTFWLYVFKPNDLYSLEQVLTVKLS